MSYRTSCLKENIGEEWVGKASLVTTNHPLSFTVTANDLVIENFVVCRGFIHLDSHTVEECLLYSGLLTVSADKKACHWTQYRGRIKPDMRKFYRI